MKQWKLVRTLNDLESLIVLITSEPDFVDLALLVGSIILVIVNWYDMFFAFLSVISDLFGWIKISKPFCLLDLFLCEPLLLYNL